MKISRNAIPPLIEAVKTLLDEELAAYERDDVREDEHYDPNDLVIFDSFVLPVLEDARDMGFETDDMLDKGFAFMVSIIPHWLNTHGDDLPGPVYGELARVYYRHTLDEATRYLDLIEDKNLRESVGSVNRYIEWCLLLDAKNLPQD